MSGGLLERVKAKIHNDHEVSNALAGGLAGAITATVVCPLDVLKTRLQVQGRHSVYYGISGESHRTGRFGGRYGYQSVAAGGLSKILRDEGVRGLYRGLSPSLFALLPNWAVYFSTYERLKVAIGGRVSPRWAQSPAVHMAAAAGAGAATMLITNPLWVIKTRLQTQDMGIRMGASHNPRLYRGTLDALVRISREEGLVGLYSGLGPSLMGVMHVVIQFPLYEALKRHFVEAKAREGKEGKLSMHELIIASAASKMVASTATYPHEVVRSHMHIAGTGAFNGLARVCKQIYLEDGLSGFYRGCMTNLLRTTPAAAVTFTSFELISTTLRRWTAASQQPPAPLPTPAAAMAAAGAAMPAQDDSDADAGAAATAAPFAAATARAVTAVPDPRLLEAHFSRVLGEDEERQEQPPPQEQRDARRR